MNCTSFSGQIPRTSNIIYSTGTIVPKLKSIPTFQTPQEDFIEVMWEGT